MADAVGQCPVEAAAPPLQVQGHPRRMATRVNRRRRGPEVTARRCRCARPARPAGLRRFLSDNVDLRVAGEAANGSEALELARGGEVDVLLMDISMPRQSGVDALAAIKARFPELPVLVLSGFPESHYATTLLRQGASGYLNKECDAEEIVTAIRTAFRGRKYIGPAVAEMLAEGLCGDGLIP